MAFRDLFNENPHNLYCNDLTLSGNLNMAGDIVLDEISVSNTKNSTSSSTGALVVSGGVGIGKDLYVGGNIFGTISGTSTTISTTMSGPWAAPLASQTVQLTKVGNIVVINYPVSLTGTVTNSQYVWGFPTALPSGYFNPNRSLSCVIPIYNNNNIQMAQVLIAVDGTWSVNSAPTILTGTSGTAVGGFTICFSII